ncbi:MAG TPA: GNAT family protein [Actinomycetota bacterium]|nr:GNAT family protein [Actinomycetota bacterium]
MGLVLNGPRVVLRPALSDDVDDLLSILREPEVARRWGSFERTEVLDQFVGDAKVFVIEIDGDVVGAIQYGEEDDPMYRHASIDIFLTTSRHNQGVGSEAIRVLAKHLIADRGHHRLTIDPATDNHAAIRAYEKVGFRKVGVMRSYERGPDGTWHDGLLMEMLADELVER